MGPSGLANAAFNFKPFHGPGLEMALNYGKTVVPEDRASDNKREEVGTRLRWVAAAGALNLLGPVIQAGVLVPEGNGVFHLLGAEVLLAELGGLLRRILAAAEHV